MVYQMPYKATTNWKFIQPHLPAKSRTRFRICLAMPTSCAAIVTSCDMWLKKFTKLFYRRCRQSQFKNWKPIKCKFLQFSHLHGQPDYWQAPPYPNSAKSHFRPHHRNHARTAAVDEFCVLDLGQKSACLISRQLFFLTCLSDHLKTGNLLTLSHLASRPTINVTIIALADKRY